MRQNYHIKHTFFNKKKTKLKKLNYLVWVIYDLLPRFVGLTLSCSWLWSNKWRSMWELKVDVYPQSGHTMGPPSRSWQNLTWSLREAPRRKVRWQNGQRCCIWTASGGQAERRVGVKTQKSSYICSYLWSDACINKPAEEVIVLKSHTYCNLRPLKQKKVNKYVFRGLMWVKLLYYSFFNLINFQILS